MSLLNFFAAVEAVTAADWEFDLELEANDAVIILSTTELISYSDLPASSKLLLLIHSSIRLFKAKLADKSLFFKFFLLIGLVLLFLSH